MGVRVEEARPSKEKMIVARSSLFEGSGFGGWPD